MSLSLWAVVVGCIILFVNLPALVSPKAFLEVVGQFPRSKWPGWVLSAVDLLCVAWIVYHAHLGSFEFLKPFIFLAAPLSFGLVVFFMNELLAPRAFGGLLMLAANPILYAARWQETDWRWVMTVIAYVWAVAGMALMLSPFRFRQVVLWVNKTEMRCRLGAAVRVLFGLFVLFLGLKVY
ncbi:MAG: hypothetical protein V2A34_15050 [Lentisphaerota bacterium]